MKKFLAALALVLTIANFGASVSRADGGIVCRVLPDGNVVCENVEE